MSIAVPLRQAARELGVSEPTLRRWVRAGAPVASRGGRGCGKGSRVVPEEVLRWKASAANPRDDLAVKLLDFWRRGGDVGEKGHRLLGIPSARAAAFLCFIAEHLGAPDSPELRILVELARQ